MQYPNKKTVRRELFGKSTRTAAIDFPSNIGQMLRNLPPFHSYTSDQLIDAHTLLPYFTLFLPPERILQLRENMRDSGGQKNHKSSGVMASRIPSPKKLRYCPACVKKDREKFSEAYWHRIHQVPGVEICPTHKVFSLNSEVHHLANRESIGFAAAEDALSRSPIRCIEITKRSHQVLLRIASDSSWLLENVSGESNLNGIYKRYIRLLIYRGLATYTGSIHVTELLDEFRRFYSPTLLKSLHCEFTGADQFKTNWLLRLVRPPRHASHPLYHLLLMQFLGCTAEEFFQLPDQLNFFGEGPWPCLNPTAEHFRKPVIPEYKLSPRLRDKRPVATFSCRCGFAYARSGPDSSPKDRFRIGRMVSFGLVWEARLKKLLKEFPLSMSEVGRRLGVDPLTVHRHAARLKLSLSRSGRKSKKLNRATKLKDKMSASDLWHKKRFTCRAMWLSVMERNPKAPLKELRHNLPNVYSWLQQHDSEWLEKHKPQAHKHTRNKSSVDWKKRDFQYAFAVKASASHLKNALGRPVQVTKTAIGRDLGAVTLLQQKLHMMPLTAQVLTNVVETHEEYAVRRVWWAAGLYFQERVLPREWQIILRANVHSLRETSSVTHAIKAAMKMIESKYARAIELIIA
jgi:hypothetical protein